jgi:hypothetical protein
MNNTIQPTHPDLAILCAHTDTKMEDLRGSCSPRFGEGNYLKVGYKWHWPAEEIEQLKSVIEAVNQLTTEYTFKYQDVSEAEVEFDNDRIWEASFTFTSHKK